MSLDPNVWSPRKQLYPVRCYTKFTKDVLSLFIPYLQTYVEISDLDT